MAKLYAKKEIVRKYYKYGTTPNVVSVGSPTIVDGEVSGFSASNYVKLPSRFEPNNSTWEFVLKVKIDDNTRQYQFLTSGRTERANCGLQTALVSGKFHLGGGNGSWWFLDHDGQTVFQNNVYYYVKIIFNGSNYSVYISTTGDFIGEESLEISVNTTQKIVNNNNFVLGLDLGNSGAGYAPANGCTIDLSKSYIKIDGQDWWHGTLVEPATEYDYDFYKDEQVWSMPTKTVTKYWKYGTIPNATIIGSPTIENGIVSGFNNSNYLVQENSFPASTIDSYEMLFKVTTGNNVSAYQAIFAEPLGDAVGVRIEIYSQRFGLLAGDGSWINISSYQTSQIVQPDTIYWIKVKYQNSTYSLEYSTDGINYTQGVSYSGRKAGNFVPYLGNLGWRWSQSDYYFYGSIDLTKSYIKIDGQDWWHGTLVEPATLNDYDFTTQEDVYYASIQGDN